MLLYIYTDYILFQSVRMKRETEDGCFLYDKVSPCPPDAACCKFIHNPDPDLLESNESDGIDN